MIAEMSFQPWNKLSDPIKRLRLFDYDSAYPFELSNEPSEPSKPLSELPASPTSNIRTTSPGLLTPTTCRVVMMIATKNGTVTTATAAMMTVWKARAPGNFVNANQIMPYATDQTFYLKLSDALIFF